MKLNRNKSLRINRSIASLYSLSAVAFGLSLGGTAMLATFSMPVNAIVSGSGEWFFRGFGDFNGDGKTDLFWHNSKTGDTGAWLMNGDRVSQYTSYDSVPCSSGWSLAGFGDFNGDGKTDLFWRKCETGETGAWLMNGDRVSQYTSYDNVPSSSGWSLAGFGDFNGDGKTDLFWRKYETGETGAWLMDGDRVSQYTSYDDVPFSSGWRLRGFGDFNGDGKTDLFWRKYETGETGAWLMNGDRVSQYTSYDDVPSSSGSRLRGFGDFNGDGKTDLFWHNSNTGETGAWLMDGDRVSHTSYDAVPADSGWSFGGFGDFNGDGKTDLFWRKYETGETGAWLMDGDRVSQYTSYDNVPSSSGWRLRGFGDFNGDGKTDLFWHNSNTGETGAWLMNGDRVSQYTSYEVVPFVEERIE